MTGAPAKPRVLVVKLGALGDVVQALGPMAAIRGHHPDAEITVLTAKPFAELIEKTGLADRIEIDARPGTIDLCGWLALRRTLRTGGYTRVYDLQTSGRSGRYFKLFWPGPWPEWSGIAKGCSHPHANPDRDRLHTVERQKEQLAMAGIDHVPAPSLDGVDADVTRFALPPRFGALVPGGAPHRPEKRWPEPNWRELAERLTAAGQPIAVLGGPGERILGAAITDGLPNAFNLAGETSLVELVAVLRRAAFAVGNDTGPMHAAAVVGIPSTVLYSHASDPALCAQRGASVTILRKPSLDDIGVDTVIRDVLPA